MDLLLSVEHRGGSFKKRLVHYFWSDPYPLPFAPTTTTVLLFSSSSHKVISHTLTYGYQSLFFCVMLFSLSLFLSLSIFLQCDVLLLGVNFLPHHYVFEWFSMVFISSLSIYRSIYPLIYLSIRHPSTLFWSLLLLLWCVLIFLVYILL